MKKIFGLIIILTIVISGGALYWESTESAKDKLPESYKIMDTLEEQGVFALPLKFTSIEGKAYDIKDFKDKIIIISFWATWCTPCVDEFPSLIKLLDAYPEKVVLLALSHDDEVMDVRKFIEAFDGYRQNMIVTLDKDKSISKSFGVNTLPEGYIFDSQGKLVKKIIGIQDWATDAAIEFFGQL
ncbi:MAG: TlpA family protein disulfide reductase [Bdellovibrionales bacterium]|nr:TlpA family protein disulfide reductase [Bdellovibrionales bacterium]